MRVLVTGGAGYIGSHVVRQLVERGDDVVAYDSLVTGHDWAVGDAELVVGDVGDRATLDRVLARGFDSVLHFAASTVVPDSVADPLSFYRNNTANTLNLFEAVTAAGIGTFLFSSTAAVYGIPAGALVDEASTLAPINPYGASKMMSERILTDLAAASSLRYGILRYFNVAGADPQGRIGQATPEATHLIKVASQAAVGVRSGLKIFGTDYDTSDGTCVRDYIHVEDLATAHLLLLDHLQAGGDSRLYNCGYGHGYSVREIVDAVHRVTGVPFLVEETDRRPGDPAQLVADSSALKRDLGWRPQYDDIDTIVSHAYTWERRLQGEQAVGWG